jgi:hypothetical protein
VVKATKDMLCAILGELRIIITEFLQIKTDAHSKNYEHHQIKRYTSLWSQN